MLLQPIMTVILSEDKNLDVFPRSKQKIHEIQMLCDSSSIEYMIMSSLKMINIYYTEITILITSDSLILTGINLLRPNTPPIYQGVECVYFTQIQQKTTR